MSLQNFTALQEFRSVWEKLDEGDVRRTGRMKVWSKVAYDTPNGNADDRTYVTILFDGYDQGTIRIDETAELPLRDLHLDFSARFQSYIFDEDYNSLVIEEAADKMGGEYSVMGGEYSVRIHPVREDATD